MRPRTAVVLALAAGVAAAIAVPLVELGGGAPRLTKAEYSRRVTAIYRAVGETFRGAGSAGTSSALRRMKAALDRAGTALASLHPPRDAARDNRLLVEATQDYASQVDLLRASVDFGDPGTIAAHLRDVTAPATIRRTLADLEEKGYRIPVTVVALR